MTKYYGKSRGKGSGTRQDERRTRIGIWWREVSRLATWLTLHRVGEVVRWRGRGWGRSECRYYRDGTRDRL